jgi:hypothetical protein
MQRNDTTVWSSIPKVLDGFRGSGIMDSIETLKH